MFGVMQILDVNNNAETTSTGKPYNIIWANLRLESAIIGI